MQCSRCGAEFVGTHVCPVSTTYTGAIKSSTTYAGVVYTSTQNNSSIGKTFRCPHMQISNVEKAVCGICGELEADEYG